MSNIYDWFERDEIKTAGKDDKNAELITYYYKCKVCLGKMNDEQAKTGYEEIGAQFNICHRQQADGLLQLSCNHDRLLLPKLMCPR
jgi:hypothetical protein